MPQSIGEERLLNGFKGQKQIFGYILQSVKSTREERKRRRRIWYVSAVALIFIFAGLVLVSNWALIP